MRSHAECCPHCGQPTPWTQDMAIAAIRRWVREYERPPICNEWKKTSSGYPSQVQVRRLFGTWNAAIEAAGFEPRSWGYQDGKPGRKPNRARQMVTARGLSDTRPGTVKHFDT